LNVGVENGSRGVGDTSGVGVELAAGVGDGDAGGLGGSCATTLSGSSKNRETTVSAHEDSLIDDFLLVLNRDGALDRTAGQSHASHQTA
jgi:hypothetical protein